MMHTARWRLGEFELDETRRELLLAGTAVPLEPKPFNMLMLLLRHPGELITKNDLMEALWTGRIVTEAVLSNCVAKLRTALGDEEARCIRTVHGYGYRLEGNPQLITEAPTVLPPEVNFAPDSPVPHRPNWRLRRRIGRSGECWLAEQPMTGEQRVFKFAFQPKALSALKREVTLYRLLRQTLEERAPILDLLDWNFDEPPWFIETEYCQLGSLQEYLDGQGGAGTLPLEQRLNIVIQIAEALAAVHSVGILHKDLKPSNVLVAPGNGDGIRIRLADFGSGRLMDDSRLQELAITRLGFTQFADPSSSGTSGTPLYYAPEVLSGQPVTLKSDVYALGVMLYQLVVGDMRRLFAPGWETGVEDELLREDIAVAAAGDPDLRLADAQLLAQRLRGLSARRQTLAIERSSKEKALATQRELEFIKARRAGLRWAAATLAAGLIVSLLLFLRAQQARREAEAATDRAEAVSNYLLRDVLGKLSAGTEPVRKLSVLELLEHASNQLEQRFAHEPLVRARINSELAAAYQQLGIREKAIRELESAYSTNSMALGATDPHSLRAASELLAQLADSASVANRLPAFESLLSRAELERGNDDIEVISLARQVASVNYLLGRIPMAERATKKVISSLKTSGRNPNLLTRSEFLLTYIQTDLGDYANAETGLHAVLYKLIQSKGKDGFEVGRCWMQLGLLLLLSGRFEESREALDQAERIANIWEPRPNDLRITIASHRCLAAIEQQDPRTARATYQRLLAAEAEGDEASGLRAYFDRYLEARLARLEGNFPKARQAIAEAERLLKLESFPEHPDLIQLALEHVAIALDEKDGTLARKILSNISAEGLSNLPPNHPLQAERLFQLGRIYQQEGNRMAAKSTLRQALLIFQSHFDLRHPRTIAVQSALNML